MINNITSSAEERMKKSIESLKVDLKKLRTGRAHPSLLEQVSVEYYNNPTPLSQVANIIVENARTLAVTPWEKDMLPKIEKAITVAGLGLNPSTTGDVVRVPLPALTEERRQSLTKIVRDVAEKARVAIRSARREANAAYKDLVKAKEISEDEEYRAQTAMQKVTDKHIAIVDGMSEEKEKDLMVI